MCLLSSPCHQLCLLPSAYNRQRVNKHPPGVQVSPSPSRHREVEVSNPQTIMCYIVLFLNTVTDNTVAIHPVVTSKNLLLSVHTLRWIFLLERSCSSQLEMHLYILGSRFRGWFGRNTSSDKTDGAERYHREAGWIYELAVGLSSCEASELSFNTTGRKNMYNAVWWFCCRSVRLQCLCV